MSVERVALTILAAIAVIMGANWISATARFYDANQAYDRLQPSLEAFEFTDAHSPVLVNIGVENPSRTSIEVLQVRITLRAGVQSVGGGTAVINELLDAGGFRVYRVEARITDRNYVDRLESESIDWLLSGELQVRLDPDIAPVWIDFRGRTVTP